MLKLSDRDLREIIMLLKTDAHSVNSSEFNLRILLSNAQQALSTNEQSPKNKEIPCMLVLPWHTSYVYY